MVSRASSGARVPNPEQTDGAGARIAFASSAGALRRDHLIIHKQKYAMLHHADELRKRTGCLVLKTAKSCLDRLISISMARCRWKEQGSLMQIVRGKVNRPFKLMLARHDSRDYIAAEDGAAWGRAA
jgi:hypothetical protein